MSSQPVNAAPAHTGSGPIHQEALRVAERLDATLSALLSELARAKGLQLKDPVRGLIHHERPSGHVHALWQLFRDRGQFMAKVELCSDEAYSRLYLKALLQGRFWDKEAQRFAETVCQVTAMPVDVERTQGDGIVTYSDSLTPSTAG
jgi:hypothetical protein